MIYLIFLRGEDVMKSLSVESRNFLLKKIREKHNGYEWSSEFESLVLNIVHTFTISLHRKWCPNVKGQLHFLLKNILSGLKRNSFYQLFYLK